MSKTSSKKVKCMFWKKAISVLCICCLILSLGVGCGQAYDEYSEVFWEDVEGDELDEIYEQNNNTSDDKKNNDSQGSNNQSTGNQGNTSNSDNRVTSAVNQAGDGLGVKIDKSKATVPHYNNTANKNVVMATSSQPTDSWIKNRVSAYKELYGGNVTVIHIDDPYQDLAKMIASGDPPDVINYEAGHLGFPKAIMTGLFQESSKYINYNDVIWQVMKNYIDVLKYQKKIYFTPTEVSPSAVVMYSRKNMKDNGLEEPASLYYKGEWNLKTFLKYAKALTADIDGDGINDTVGVYSDNFESLLHACGKDYVGADDRGYTLNLNDSNIKRMMSFFSTLNKAKVFTKLGYTNAQACLRDGRLGMHINNNPGILYPDMIESGDLGVAPIPMDADADKYYHSVYMHGYYILKDAKNPKAAADLIAAHCIEVNFNWLIPSKKTTYKESTEMYTASAIYGSIFENCYPVLLNFNGISSETAYYNLYNAVLEDGKSWSSVIETYTPILQNDINNATKS